MAKFDLFEIKKKLDAEKVNKEVKETVGQKTSRFPLPSDGKTRAESRGAAQYDVFQEFFHL